MDELDTAVKHIHLMIRDAIELQEAWEGGWDPSTTTTGIQLGW